MELRGQTALVTGASGFVGGHAARRMAEVEGMRVRALVRDPARKTLVDLRHSNIEVVRGDVLAPTTIAVASRDVKLVLHAAMTTRGTTRKQAWATAVEGTRNVYQAACAASAARFIYLSSFAVYFGVADHPYDEETPVAPSGDLYGDAKIAAERCLRSMPAGGPIPIIMRPPAIYGPASSFWSIRFVEVAKQGRLFLPARGQFSIAYTFIDNLIDAIVAAAKARVGGGVYNIFDGHMLYRDFVTPYAQMAGAQPRHLPVVMLRALALSVELSLRLCGRWIAFSRPSVDFLLTGDSHASLTAAKAERELHWTPKVSFEAGMEATHRWLNEHGYLQ